MPEHYHYDEGGIVNLEPHHKKSAVAVKPLLWSVAIFIVFGVITHFTVLGMYHFFAATENSKEKVNAPMTEIARPEDLSVPVEPRLQPFPSKGANGEYTNHPNHDTPVTDMDAMHAAEHDAQTSYGWA